MIDNEITTGELAKLLDVTGKTIAQLGRDGVLLRGSKRGTWQTHPSVANYVRRLREESAGRGGEDAKAARARLATAQATLNETRAKQFAGELVEASEVEAKWTAACRSIKMRVLAVADRMCDLSAKENTRLVAELRSALIDLADTARQLELADFHERFAAAICKKG